jgi:2'-5' RNA ligase
LRQSAVVIEVPEAAPAVDEWRRQYTRDGPLGVPAHVTLLYPFVPPERLDEEVEAKLGDVIGEAEPFDFALRRTDRFSEQLLYLAPEPPEPFLRLTQAIAAAWPEHPPYEGAHETVIPHLTVASADDPVLESITAALERKLPIHARATEALLLEEGEDGFWRPRLAFRLGASA